MHLEIQVTMKNKLFCKHEVNWFQDRLTMRTVSTEDHDFEIGPNLVRCRSVEKESFVIEPDKDGSDVVKWLII